MTVEIERGEADGEGGSLVLLVAENLWPREVGPAADNL